MTGKQVLMKALQSHRTAYGYRVTSETHPAAGCAAALLQLLDGSDDGSRVFVVPVRVLVHRPSVFVHSPDERRAELRHVCGRQGIAVRGKGLPVTVLLPAFGAHSFEFLVQAL